MNNALPKPVLTIRDLRLAFGDRRHQTPVLHGISLHIQPGEKVAVPASR